MKDSIKLPPGYSARAIQPVDFKNLGEFQEQVDQHQCRRIMLSKEMLEWTLNSPETTLETNSLVVFTTSGETVGYTVLYDHRKPLLKMSALLTLHPEDRDVDKFLLDWVQKKAFSALHKSEQGTRVTLMIDVKNNFFPKANLLLENGFEHVRTFEFFERNFTAPVKTPVLQDGLTIRRVKTDEIRFVFNIRVQAFKDHYGNVEMNPEEGFKIWNHWMLKNPSYDPDFWYIAELDGKAAGICLGYPNYTSHPGFGYVYTLGVLKEFRRKGIAKALLQYSMYQFYQAGNKGAFLEVDATSLTGANCLYQKAGMESVVCEYMYEKELQAGKDMVIRSLT